MGTKSDVAVAVAGIGTVIGLFAFALGVIVLKIWLLFSLATSTIKVVKDDCGQTYRIERFASGNWFCPSSK